MSNTETIFHVFHRESSEEMLKSVQHGNLSCFRFKVEVTKKIVTKGWESQKSLRFKGRKKMRFLVAKISFQEIEPVRTEAAARFLRH